MSSRTARTEQTDPVLKKERKRERERERERDGWREGGKELAICKGNGYISLTALVRAPENRGEEENVF